MEKRVLMVDDDEAVLFLLGVMMQKEGWNTFDALSGEECLNRIEEIKPDVILLDFNMPGMDGLEVLQKMKERGRNIPAIVVTASAQEEVARLFLKAGAFDFLSKPVKSSDLIFSTEKALKYRILLNRLSEYK